MAYIFSKHFIAFVCVCGCCMLQLALLCGPPGLGKTTLAHIIAKHAGYNVVEMNARLINIPRCIATHSFHDLWFDYVYILPG